MEKTIFATFVAVYFLALAACSGSKEAKNDVEQVSYHEARNYFLNLGQEVAVGQKITNEHDFNRYFGMAAYMGKDGEPTHIDFDFFTRPIKLLVVDKAYRYAQVQLNKE